jgi:hypothetical protein
MRELFVGVSDAVFNGNFASGGLLHGFNHFGQHVQPFEPLLSDGVRHGSEIPTGFLFAEHRGAPKVFLMRITV